MSQTATQQEEARGKGTASQCLPRDQTSLLVQARGGGKREGSRVGKRVGMRLRRWTEVRSYKVLEATFEGEEFCRKANGEP